MSLSAHHVPRRGRLNPLVAVLAVLATSLAVVVATPGVAHAAPTITGMPDSGPPGASWHFDITDCEGPDQEVLPADDVVTQEQSGAPITAGIEVDLDDDGQGGTLTTFLTTAKDDIHINLICRTEAADSEDPPTDEEFFFAYDIQGRAPRITPSPDVATPGEELVFDPADCVGTPAESTLDVVFHWAQSAGTATSLPNFVSAPFDAATITSDEEGVLPPVVMGEVPDPIDDLGEEEGFGVKYLIADFRCESDPAGAFSAKYEYLAVPLPPPAEADLPTAPLNPVGTPGNGRVIVEWDAPLQSGGGPITGYEVEASPGGRTCTTQGALSCAVTGLTNGEPYKFRVRATNAQDFGPWSEYSILYRPFPNPLPANGFADVPRNSYYAQAVDWAALFGITTGVSPGRFGPFESLLRSQIVTFLWRFADEPLGFQHHAFADVPGGTFYDNALRWARATGVTTGISPQFFAPDQTVTRAQMVTFAWRAAGQKTGFANHGFADVPGGTYYEQALQWAKALDITTGVGGTNRFEPDRSVNRAEAITFLFRVAVTPQAWANPNGAPSTVLF